MGELVRSETFGPPSLLLHHISQTSKSPAFIPNGLLSASSSDSNDFTRATDDDDVDSDAFLTSQLESQASLDKDNVTFIPNGLLGPPDPGLTHIATSLLCPSQPNGSFRFPEKPIVVDTSIVDDDFPEISDLLRAHPIPTAAKVSANINSLDSVLPSFIIRASSYEGKPVQLKKKTLADRTRKKITPKGEIGKLLDVPIHRLLDELAASTADKLDNPSQLSGPASSSHEDNDLWVDRYRPQRYTDLLGDDRVHREVLAWVKEWDWCVFGKSKGKKTAKDDYQDLDEYRRPREKILLVSGPPGLGKTTLAHIVAQQAGYKAFEINASDARSGQVVDERIRPALESGSAVGSSKPVLVVIDEIDGATGAGDTSSGFIQKLVQLIQEKPKTRRKADKGKRPILRPIICICNDLYASSLTKLRAHARIVRLARPMDVHLVKRLREICGLEDLKADSQALSTLVGIAQGDLRGCLNTLQFIKSRGELVTEPMVRKATVGMKEMECSNLDVLNDLFSPMPKKRVKELGLGEEEESKYVGRLSREVDATGSIERVAIGCFEHYTNVHKHDGTFSRYDKALAWLGSYDLMSGEMRSEREYSILQYLPYLIVPFYPLFQERGARRVERPKTDWENFLKTRTHEEIYTSFARCIRTASGRESGCFRHLVSDQVLQLEMSPYLNRILSPPLRPINSQVIKPDERAMLSRLVDLMISLELRFVQDRAEDGQLIYRLEPPIDAFVTYDGKRASDIAISRFAVRQLVASEIEARITSRQIESIQKRVPAKQSFFKRNRDAADHMDEQHTNKRPKLEKTDIADRPPTDFFGRLIEVKPVDTSTMKPKSANQKPRVSYKFHEGNSSAVRKPVKLSSFT